MLSFGVARRVALPAVIIGLLITAGVSSVTLANAIDVRVDHGWARPAIAGGNGAAYLRITNLGEETVTLIDASSAVANHTEVHETYVIDPEHMHEGQHGAGDEHGHDHEHHAHHIHEEGHHGHGGAAMLGMRKIDALAIAPGETVHFSPGGYHVMLIDLVDGLTWGEQFDVTLHFQGGHSVTATIDVGNEPSH